MYTIDPIHCFQDTVCKTYLVLFLHAEAGEGSQYITLAILLSFNSISFPWKGENKYMYLSILLINPALVYLAFSVKEHMLILCASRYYWQVQS